MSARAASYRLEFTVHTVQKYIKDYKDLDNIEFLPCRLNMKAVTSLYAFAKKFGRSPKSTRPPVTVASNHEVMVSILCAICEREVLDLTLRKPKSVKKSLILGLALVLSISLTSYRGILDCVNAHDLKDICKKNSHLC
ncbi:MAG: hypothetical protein EXX96DRAFT_538747 [Benjaminiella poitrasii]|nr:MAG: hypothetical protein EXX96DRAFT_538747 [Benjaminiella poitrasii]